MNTDAIRHRDVAFDPQVYPGPAHNHWAEPDDDDAILPALLIGAGMAGIPLLIIGVILGAVLF